MCYGILRRGTVLRSLEYNGFDAPGNTGNMLAGCLREHRPKTKYRNWDAYGPPQGQGDSQWRRTKNTSQVMGPSSLIKAVLRRTTVTIIWIQKSRQKEVLDVQDCLIWATVRDSAKGRST